jgi:hypothetical protein
VNACGPRLYQELSAQYEVVLDGSVTYARESPISGADSTATSSHPAFLACHRCLVILGDLGSLVIIIGL